MKYKDDILFCCYCGQKFTALNKCTSDHLIPKSKGGVDNNYNKRNCCFDCNTEKGSRYLQLWLRQLKRKFKKATDPTFLYDLSIKIHNVEYIIEYVESAGEKLFIDKYHYEYYLGNKDKVGIIVSPILK